jgi:hypothetical protein
MKYALLLVAYDKHTHSTLLQARFRTAQGDITLLQWLSTAEKAISVLEPVRGDGYGFVCIVLIRAFQIQSQLQSSVTSLHEAFQRILLFVPSGNSKDHASATGLPQPGRPIRALISRCLVKLHQNVEDRSLFDFVQVLMKGVMENNANVLKHGQDLVYKV